jgi:hypothetical protein
MKTFILDAGHNITAYASQEAAANAVPPRLVLCSRAKCPVLRFAWYSSDVLFHEGLGYYGITLQPLPCHSKELSPPRQDRQIGY